MLLLEDLDVSSSSGWEVTVAVVFEKSNHVVSAASSDDDDSVKDNSGIGIKSLEVVCLPDSRRLSVGVECVRSLPGKTMALEVSDASTGVLFSGTNLVSTGLVRSVLQEKFPPKLFRRDIFVLNVDELSVDQTSPSLISNMNSPWEIVFLATSQFPTLLSVAVVAEWKEHASLLRVFDSSSFNVLSTVVLERMDGLPYVGDRKPTGRSFFASSPTEATGFRLF